MAYSLCCVKVWFSYSIHARQVYATGKLLTMTSLLARSLKGTQLSMIRPEAKLTLLGSSAPPDPVHWMVARPTNSFFTGQEDVLEEMEGIVLDAVETPTQTQCRIVISGMDGQGKSEICVQLAYRLRLV
jgi:hypothetical protein